MTFDAAEAAGPIRAWRDLLPEAPREATLTCDAGAAPPEFPVERLRGRPIVIIGFVFVGDMTAARPYLDTFRAAVGEPASEDVSEMAYTELQTLGDDYHHHGRRRYSTGHYMTELPDEAIDAFLSRGLAAGSPEPDWTRQPGAGFQAYGGAIAEVGQDEAAFDFRDTLVEWFAGSSWDDSAEDFDRMAGARAWGKALDPWGAGVYVNVITDEGTGGARRAYRPAKFARLQELKRAWDPDNVFHLNQNIPPSDSA